MPTRDFSVFQVDANYYDLEDGYVLGADTLTISDSDNLMHASIADDPGGDQFFSFAGEASVTDYIVDFLDFTQVNLSGPSYEAFAMNVTFADGSTKYYVMSKDAGFAPSIGDRLTVTTYSIFENTDYGDIGAITCFLAGTRISTPNGLRAVEDLECGDLVTTADHGPQKIRLILNRSLDEADLSLAPHLRPILIRPGFIFAPRAPLFVSPQHRMLLRLPDGREWMVPAKMLAEELPNMARVAKGKRAVCYVHLLFDRHEVIFAEGVPTESLHLGRTGIHSIDRAAQSEIFRLFPSAALRLIISAQNIGHLARPPLHRSALRRLVKEGCLKPVPQRYGT